MDHDPLKVARLKFTIKIYMETTSPNNHVSYTFELQFRCNELINYKIKSNIGEKKTIILYLDEIPNDQKSRFEFDDFECNPKDCC